jgi:hypothetical protein
MGALRHIDPTRPARNTLRHEETPVKKLHERLCTPSTSSKRFAHRSVKSVVIGLIPMSQPVRK